jgi:hypothetical protein
MNGIAVVLLSIAQHLRNLRLRADPPWLRDKPHYSVWQRNMQWMIAGSQEIGTDNVRLMTLWDEVNREGYGGVSDFVNQAKALGMPTPIVPLKPLASQAAAFA